MLYIGRNQALTYCAFALDVKTQCNEDEINCVEKYKSLKSQFGQAALAMPHGTVHCIPHATDTFNINEVKIPVELGLPTPTRIILNKLEINSVDPEESDDDSIARPGILFDFDVEGTVFGYDKNKNDIAMEFLKDIFIHSCISSTEKLDEIPEQMVKKTVEELIALSDDDNADKNKKDMEDNLSRYGMQETLIQGIGKSKADKDQALGVHASGRVSDKNQLALEEMDVEVFLNVKRKNYTYENGEINTYKVWQYGLSVGMESTPNFENIDLVAGINGVLELGGNQNRNAEYSYGPARLKFSIDYISPQDRDVHRLKPGSDLRFQLDFDWYFILYKYLRVDFAGEFAYSKQDLNPSDASGGNHWYKLLEISLSSAKATTGVKPYLKIIAGKNGVVFERSREAIFGLDFSNFLTGAR